MPKTIDAITRANAEYYRDMSIGKECGPKRLTMAEYNLARNPASGNAAVRSSMWRYGEREQSADVFLQCFAGCILAISSDGR
jgi:hypothetical protein